MNKKIHTIGAPAGSSKTHGFTREPLRRRWVPVLAQQRSKGCKGEETTEAAVYLITQTAQLLLFDPWTHRKEEASRSCLLALANDDAPPSRLAFLVCLLWRHAVMLLLRFCVCCVFAKGGPPARERRKRGHSLPPRRPVCCCSDRCWSASVSNDSSASFGFSDLLLAGATLRYGVLLLISFRPSTHFLLFLSFLQPRVSISIKHRATFRFVARKQERQSCLAPSDDAVLAFLSSKRRPAPACSNGSRAAARRRPSLLQPRCNERNVGAVDPVD